MEPESFDDLRRIEHELSLVEAAIGQLAFERFPEHPGFASDEQDIRAWLSAHDIRTERLDDLVVRRGALLDDLRDILSE